MSIDFKNIDYLKDGTFEQKEIYHLIMEYNVLEILKDYNPIIVGTFPIQINIENSDVDIILYAQDHQVLADLLTNHFSEFENFSIRIVENNIVICNFVINNYPFEIFAQRLETEKQYGYLHMLKEYEILEAKDEIFAEKIRELKRNGLKTEPAFCRLLEIQGDPYIELLNYTIS